jgi:transcription regulator MmyB-like protein
MASSELSAYLRSRRGQVTPGQAGLAAGDRVDPSLLQLMSAWPDNPAVVYNRAFDVLASNLLADALFHSWAHSRNLMHLVFTDPRAHAEPGWAGSDALALLGSLVAVST